MHISRRLTRDIKIGKVGIGSNHPVSIQSMTNTNTKDVQATLAQINELAELGCKIIRVALPDIESAEIVKDIVKYSPIPVVGDIHFDYRIVLKAISSGIHAIRINPGNIGGEDKIKEIAKAAGEANISIRVGANTGSLSKEFLDRTKPSDMTYEEKMALSLVESAKKQCDILEKFGFANIKVSLKSSDVKTSFLAYKKFADETNYPLHLGITEAGTFFRSSVKSSIGIGSLLLLGIGDTLRVSITGSPSEEMKVAKAILESLGIIKAAPEIISCPTCSRTSTDIIKLTSKVEEHIEKLKKSGVFFKPFKLAIMGCSVNGPGEAREADIGIAGASGKFILFKKGLSIKGTLTESEIFDKLIEEISHFLEK